MTIQNPHVRPSRRGFLKGLGAAGAGLLAGSAGTGSATADLAVRPLGPGGYNRSGAGAPSSPGDFGRIFPNLPAFADVNDTVRAALLEVGMAGGIMDAGDQLSAGPKALIVDPTVDGNPTVGDSYGSNPDNPTMSAGSTFVGQFIDHDITFDQTSRLGVSQNPLISPNTRTPLLDLDSVFGGGPGIRPDLYVQQPDGSVGPKLKIGSGGVHEDVPRTPNGDGTYTALLGDPRNDENVIVAGMHCAHILFYNRVLDELSEHDLGRLPLARAHRADRANNYVAFLLARQVTLWHYQWLLVNEHLPQLAGQNVVNDVLAHGNRFYRPPAGDAFMPIEFGGACYRFGHSMVRPSYRANFTSGTRDSTSPTADPFFALVFDKNEPDFSDPVSYDRDDLLGGYPAPRRYIGWQTFFDLGDGNVKNNKKIDPLISSVLFTLPVPAIAPHTQTSPTVLPQRTLLRQLT
ncbi:MAG: twin-arginine translocation signal domain-containing protein, partial [Solirubrobacterales bacterium]|nr:twin-arginine translocation signal domain-containing protein [Solirubrobacterales bacterium]